VAKLLRRAFGWRIGHGLLGFNVAVLGASALIFGLEPALYTLLLAFASRHMVDLIQENTSRREQLGSSPREARQCGWRSYRTWSEA
jgi:uncharacterized membrane-anchored protein YitT (DUF2179 family)